MPAETRPGGSECGPEPASPQVPAAAPDCHTRYSTGTDGWRHDDHAHGYPAAVRNAGKRNHVRNAAR